MLDHRGKSFRIAVVIPAYNEEVLIGRTLQSVPHFVDAIVVVNDASTDNTDAAIAAAGDDRVHLIRHPENRGPGAAICSGYEWALAHAIDVMVVIGADNQMNCDEMQQVLAPVLEGAADYAKGNRFGHPRVWEVIPLVRHMGMRVLSLLTKISSGYWSVSDSQCGFTAIAAGCVARLELDQVYPRYGYPNDLLAHLKAIEARVVEVPVEPIYGEARSGISLVRSLFTMPYVLARSWWWRQMYARRPRLERT